MFMYIYSGNIFVIFVEIYCQSETSPIAFFLGGGDTFYL